MLRIGFTGTRNGCTEKQKETFGRLIREFASENSEMEFHHGDCIGSDADTHDLIKSYNKTRSTGNPMIFPQIRIFGHPPFNPKARAFKECDFLLPEKDYIDRNHDIVNTCHILIATPKGYVEELRSGTWATIRYAIKTDKPVWIIFPDGNIRER